MMMVSDFFTISVAFRADIGIEYFLAVFGILVLVNLLKWFKKQ